MASGPVALTEAPLPRVGTAPADELPDRRSRSGGRPEGDLRVVIADADVLLRSGLASLLHAMGVVVVGHAGDPTTFLDLVRTRTPDLVLVDVRMPTSAALEGIEAAELVREEHPEVGMVLLSTDVEVESVTTLLATGSGIGYVLKDRVVDVQDFVDTLRRVARGGTVVDPALVREMVAQRRRHDPLEALSPRERDVLTLMADGRSNCGIAEALWLSPATVEKHVHSILSKLDVPDGPGDHRRVLAVLTFLRAA